MDTAIIIALIGVAGSAAVAVLNQLLAGRRIRQALRSGRLRSLGCLVVLLPRSSRPTLVRAQIWGVARSFLHFFLITSPRLDQSASQ